MKMYFFSPFLLILVHSLLVSCSRTGTPGFTIAREDSLRYEGKTVELFRMTNRNGMTVKVTNYGASLTFVSAPDKEGVFAPVVLGLDSLRYYLGRQPKLGATVGNFPSIRQCQHHAAEHRFGKSYLRTGIPEEPADWRLWSGVTA